MSESGIAQLIPLILIFIIFYFFLIRPQQKKVKEHKVMVEGLKRGDKVITSGGIVGTVERIIENDRAEILIADNVKVEVWNRTKKIVNLSVIFFEIKNNFNNSFLSFFNIF